MMVVGLETPSITPLWCNVYRWLAVAVVIGGLLVWRDCIKQPKLTIQYAGLAVLGAIGFQFILGIITLLTGVWLPVALAHQFGALVLLSNHGNPALLQHVTTFRDAVLAVVATIPKGKS